MAVVISVSYLYTFRNFVLIHGLLIMQFLIHPDGRCNVCFKAVISIRQRLQTLFQRRRKKNKRNWQWVVRGSFVMCWVKIWSTSFAHILKAQPRSTLRSMEIPMFYQLNYCSFVLRWHFHLCFNRVLSSHLHCYSIDPEAAVECMTSSQPSNAKPLTVFAGSKN